MFVRTALVAAAAALALPLLGGTASASCLDDLQATDLDAGYTESPKSDRWGSGGGLVFDHVEYSGTANITVHGDALVSDWVSWYTVDWPAYALTHATNAAEATTTFADCVAG